MELNTENYCFICLQTCKNKRDMTVALENICKLLKIEGQVPCKFENQPKESIPMDVKVLFCKSCRKVAEKLSELYEKMKAIKLETDHYLGEMHKRISKSDKDTELVQNYSNGRTSNEDAIKHRITVDNRRKIFVQKLSTKHFAPFKMQLEVERCDAERTSTSSGSEMPIFVKLEKLEAEEDILSSSDDIEDGMDFNIDIGNMDSNELPSESHEVPSSEEEEESIQAKADFKLEEGEDEMNPVFTNQPSSSQTSALESRKKKVVPSEKIQFNSITNQYECGDCDKSYGAYSSATRHYNITHLNLFKCKNCGIVLSSRLSLKDHLTICDPDPLKVPRRRISNDRTYEFRCVSCSKKYATIYDLAMHRKTVHSIITRFACHLCDRRFKNSWQLENHKKQAHYDIIYKCKFCHRTCSDKFARKVHEKICSVGKLCKPEYILP